MGNDEGGALHLLDNLGHGEGFAGPGDTQKGLVVLAPFQVLGQLLDRLGLVTRRFIVGNEFKGHFGILGQAKREFKLTPE
jgi:hypothetical protein